MDTDALPVLEELIPGSRKLYLTFGGLQGALGIPPFEFYKSSRILNESRVFFRDLSQTWYHAGLAGISSNIPETARYIEHIIDKSSAEEIVFIGNSMGGYAAILFSTLIGRGRAVSFSPQTFISPSKRRASGDGRWRSKVLRTYGAALFKPKFFDLQRVLEKSSGDNRIDIFVSSLDGLDVIHARNLEPFGNVRVTERELGGHNLVKHLRDSGELQLILRG
ncbi:hypothetical protein ABZN20_04695 [Methylococcus sp. ANG]|uniref:hypothetical protein n=1 Tax=unclassified Methylococcus TaxID=2618889 RepID=UPI001C52E34E|nr:hypothetical protein [Methylococcus sp. Mc7]QXP83730.1 hypothetical protein KW115_16485 [Methylococcus sp. Mc7]